MGTEIGGFLLIESAKILIFLAIQAKQMNFFKVDQYKQNKKFGDTKMWVSPSNEVTKIQTF